MSESNNNSALLSTVWLTKKEMRKPKRWKEEVKYSEREGHLNCLICYKKRERRSSSDEDTDEIERLYWMKEWKEGNTLQVVQTPLQL